MYNRIGNIYNMYKQEQDGVSVTATKTLQWDSLSAAQLIS